MLSNRLLKDRNVPAASHEPQMLCSPTGHVVNINIHTSWYYKATINDHCRITGLRVAVYLNLHQRKNRWTKRLIEEHNRTADLAVELALSAFRKKILEVLRSGEVP